MKSFLVSMAAVLILCTPASATGLEDIWGDVHPLLSNAVEQLDLRASLPDKTWNPIDKDKASVDSSINRLLDECIEVLGISNMSETKTAIRKLQEDSHYCRKKIAELKTERLAAPAKVKKWEVWKMDASTIDKTIAELEAREDDNGRRVEELVGKLLDEMRALGMKVDREQVETLVYSVTGDDDVQLISVFNNVKLITVELQRLTAETDENIEMAKRYYGMHTLLLRILINLYQQYEDRIDNVYLVRINGIITKQQDLIARTKEQIATASQKYILAYKSNLIAQGLTVRTAHMYEDYLKRNKQRVTRARKGIDEEYAVALNTYETVQGAHSLISLMRTANAMLDRLSTLQTPELIVFQNSEMKNEFRKLTLKLNSGE